MPDEIHARITKFRCGSLNGSAENTKFYHMSISSTQEARELQMSRQLAWRAWEYKRRPCLLLSSVFSPLSFCHLA